MHNSIGLVSNALRAAHIAYIGFRRRSD